MKRRRWVGIALATSTAAAAFISCKHASTTSGTGGGSASSSKSSSSTSGTGGGEGGSGAGGGSGGATVDAGPIVCAVPYTNAVKGPCDLLQQDCPQGQTCSPFQSGASVSTACVVSDGLKTAGEECYSPDECDARLICIGTPVGKCVAFCCNDAESEPCNGGLCITHVSLDSNDVYYAYVCSYGKRCTLLTPDACPPGQGCYVEDLAQGLAVCDERSPTPAPELGACTFLNDCDTMQSCFRAQNINGGVCLYYCDLSGADTGAAPGLGGCPTGETCESTYQGTKIDTGVANIGLCIPDGGVMQPDGG